jgi:hypothetical protein
MHYQMEKSSTFDRATEEGEAEIEYLTNTSVDTEEELRQTWRGELNQAASTLGKFIN